MRISGQYHHTTHIKDAGPSVPQQGRSRMLRALYILANGANRSVEIPGAALYNTLNFFRDVADVLPRFADQNSYAFEYQNQRYQLTCGAGLCTLLQSVPKEASLGEEVAQALAAIVTFGLASCSSEPPQHQWQPVAQFKDADAATDSVSQSDTQLEAGDQSTDIQDTQPNSKVCIDSDGGNKPFAAGFVVTDPNISQEKTHVDVCKDSTYLYEQTCEGDQYKQVIVKCPDVLPGGACVQDSASGKCAVPPAPMDAGSTDTGAATFDAMNAVDTGPDIPPTPDVPPVDYLKQNPLPLALDLTGSKGFSGFVPDNSCVDGKMDIKPTQLSQCLYLNALFDVDGKPIVATSYSDLVNKVANGGEFFTALITGDKEYPKLAIGKPVGFKHSKLVGGSFTPPATVNMPVMAHVYPEGSSLEIGLQFYEKASPTAPSYTSCYATYWAPNGFASCVK